MSELSFDHWNALAPVGDRALPSAVLQLPEIDAALRQLLGSQFGPKPEPEPDHKLRILDLGCGTGHSSALLCETLATRVGSLTLVDGGEATLERAKQRLAGFEPRVVRAELDALQQLADLPEGGFDLVISAYAIHHLSHPEKRALFATISRLLALGGKFILLDILHLPGFERELADSAYRASSMAGSGDVALACAPTISQTLDRRATVNEHIEWLRQSDMEPACAWRGLDSAIFVARARARRGNHDFRPELAPPQFDSVLETIGNTPLVALRRVCQDLEGLVLMKLESFNPGQSPRDRVAVEMLRAARRSAALEPGQTVVEVTNGSTGTGLAISCGVLGHPFVAVMSRGAATLPAQMMRSCGAQVVLVDQAPDSTPGQVSDRDLALVEAHAQRLAHERGYFRVDRFELRANVRAHEHGTAQELLRQSNSPIDGFVDFVGSGGSFTGVARALKAVWPSTVCMAIEPATAPSRRDLSRLDSSYCDGVLTVTDAEAIARAQELARVEGIFAGYATGASLAGALQLIERLGPGAVVACLASDSGLSYASPDLYG
jgi:cysteine synthase A